MAELFELLAVTAGADIPDLIPPSPPWMREAACRHADPALFFPERTDNVAAAVAGARVICGSCPVSGECLRWAVDNDESGVWGGTTERERRRVPRSAA